MPPTALSSAAQLQAAQASASKRRRWYLGIQSKKDPAHVMTEVYKALMSVSRPTRLHEPVLRTGLVPDACAAPWSLLQLDCEWTILSSYRVKCRWRPNMRRSFDHIGHRPSFTLARKSSSHGYGRQASHASFGSSSAMDVSDDSPDFWPVDPSQEETNPLLALDYTVIIGLNLYKVRTCDAHL